MRDVSGERLRRERESAGGGLALPLATALTLTLYRTRDAGRRRHTFYFKYNDLLAHERVYKEYRTDFCAEDLF